MLVIGDNFLNFPIFNMHFEFFYELCLPEALEYPNGVTKNSEQVELIWV